jgi:diguanylate cyclase (GGDEF)-like protein
MNNIELSDMEKFTSLMYPIFDVGLFIVIVLLFFNNANDKSYFKSKIILVIACTWLLLDQTFSLMSILGIYQSGSWMDPLWAAAFLGLSIVALRSAEFHLYPHVLPGAAVQDIDQGVTNRRIFFTYGIMLTFMLLWCLEYIKKDPFSIGGIAIILLLILRQYFSLLEKRRLMELLIQSNNDLQEAKTCIEYELRTDYLTRLFNRRYVDVALAELQKTARVNSTPFSVLVMDVDHFKYINDQYGHGVGDQVLQQIAAIININIRKDDIAARWGGEEFVIILPETGEAIAYSIGERIRSEIAGNRFKSDTGQENIKLSVSIGISEVDSYEQDFWKVLLRADQGMYEAKYAGRNRTVIKRAS